MAAKYSCPMCAFSTRRNNALIDHVCRIHRHDPNFRVYCSNCLRSYNKWDSYRKHISRGCGSQIEEHEDLLRNDVNTAPNSEVDSSDGEMDQSLDISQNIEGPEAGSLKWHEAAFILTIKEKYAVSQAAIDHTLCAVNELVRAVIKIVSAKLKQELPTQSMDLVTQVISDTFPLFSELSSAYLQMKFFRDTFNVIEPVPIILGQRLIWKNRKGRRRAVTVQDKFYYVSLIDSLKALLQLPDIKEEVDSGHYSSDGIMRDICDGSFVRVNYGAEYDSRKLLLAFYCDEVEVANPLGSRRGKHKLCMVYWSLLNIHPAYRSTTRAIQLLATVNSKILKTYGFDSILKPAINKLERLSKGISLLYSGQETTFTGNLVVFIADTPAAAMAGGFKEGVGGAKKPCRTCMISKEELSVKIRCSELRLRRLQQHLIHCALLDADDSFSRDCGVNRLTILNDVQLFDVCKCMPHDVMHVLLEGALPLHWKLLLRHCIVDLKYFTLDYLNRQISHFRYGYSETANKPRQIDRERISGEEKIIQSASQMWLLGRLLPLMVGTHVPDDDQHWVCYQLLLGILVLATSFEITDDTIALLTKLVQDYLLIFNPIYPHSIVPKLHYMLHLPEQMLRFGPLRQQWCMRFESKNAYIKQLVGKNFKNLPKSVSERHQLFMCLQHLCAPGVESNTFLYSGDTIGKVEHFSAESLLPRGLDNPFPDYPTLSTTKSVKCHGCEFRPGAIVCLRRPCDDEFPVFGEILHIILLNDMKYLLVQQMEARYFDYHFYSYPINALSEHRLVKISDLAMHQVLHKYCVNFTYYVVVRSCDHVELPFL